MNGSVLRESAMIFGGSPYAGPMDPSGTGVRRHTLQTLLEPGVAVRSAGFAHPECLEYPGSPR